MFLLAARSTSGMHVVKHNPIYLLAAFGLLLATTSFAVADIPPSPEQRKKMAETPRIMPKGSVTPLADRPFARSVGGGKAKVIIPKAVFDELAAAVTAKSGAEPVSPTKKLGGIPPIALVFAGLTLSGAFLYALAKAPRYRTVAAASAILLAAGSVFVWSQQAEANAGPIPPRAKEGQIIIEVPSEGTEVTIIIPEAEPKAAAPESKPK